MENLAEKLTDAPAVQEYGRVRGREGTALVVETGSGVYRTKRAVSCVVEPEIGDLVLAAFAPYGPGYVLAVLERRPGAKAILSFEADVEIKTAGGRMGVTARDGLDLASEKELNLLSPNLGITAAEGRFNVERLSFWGSLVEGCLGGLKLIADTCDTFLKRLNVVTRHSYRQVEEQDQVRCGRLDYQADQSLQLRGGFTQVTAAGDVHLDGKRVNIG
ncbi:MAG: DUF3540 domain-containing protein [Thermodesulfobacteriota bacterium]